MTKEQCLALFLLAGFTVSHVEQLPDVPDYAELRKNSPWWYVKTEFGYIKIGERERVISIHWDDTPLRLWITKDDVTKNLTMVHAWSWVKTLEYLTDLFVRLRRLTPVDPNDGGAVMTVKEFIDACNVNALTDDDGFGFFLNVGDDKQPRTDIPARASAMAGKLAEDFHPFTHVVWINE